MKHTRIYSIWCGMKARCYGKSDKNYSRYGAVGISVCDEWKDDFMSFYNWSMQNGYSDDLTIDRIDGKKGYCPENCRWVDYKVQANNTTRNRIITYNGQSKTMSEWAICFRKYV